MARPPHPDLRLTIPADAQFRRVAADLAVKFAEYSGCNAGTASTLRRAVEKLLRRAYRFLQENREGEGADRALTHRPNHERSADG